MIKICYKCQKLLNFEGRLCPVCSLEERLKTTMKIQDMDYPFVYRGIYGNHDKEQCTWTMPPV